MELSELKDSIGYIGRTVKGSAHIAIELEEGYISVNGDDQIPSASLIKVPILIESLRQVQANQVSLDSEIAITKGDRVGGMGVLQRLEGISSLSFKDLLTLMIIVSDNTASNIIINKVGFTAVNRMAKELGCEETLLNRYFMDIDQAKKGFDNYISPRNMLTFLKVINQESFLTLENRALAMKMLKNQQFNSKLPLCIENNLVPGTLSIAHKTGELPGAEHDVGIFELGDKKAFVAVSLINLEKNVEGQKKIAEIGSTVYRYLKSNP